MRFALALALAAVLLLLPDTSQAQRMTDRSGDPITVAKSPSSVVSTVQIFIARIEALDDAGPELNAVIAYADKADLHAVSQTEGLLEGRTVLVKDNIETREFPTTAGSLALVANDTGRDAPLIARMRENGGVVLGKTNLSEWANIRSSESTSGWSAVGGLTRNPHGIDRNTCGSSSGSGAAVAAGLAWGAIGTETDGSITCPASLNGVVGFKPTVGLVSQELIVPISASQDTAGPMTTTVADAALLLSAIAGPDYGALGGSEEPYDFTVGLRTTSLAGVRVGVLRERCGEFAPLCNIYERALQDMRDAGAVLVEMTHDTDPAMGRDEFTVLLYEFREGLDAYLAGSPADIPVRSLADVIAFNEANADTEMRWFGQDIFVAALQTTDRAAYEAARANSFRLAGPEGIDALLAKHDVAFLVAPTRGPAWVSDLVNGDNYRSGIGFGSFAAIAGYPHLTVPMGAIEGLPVGLSFIGTAWSDHAILQAGAAYERARRFSLPTPSLRRWGIATPVEALVEPAVRSDAD
ncbi:MAG: amidase [Alteraurantiacibacter sp.]